jgi:hypothetical protein
MEKVSGMQLKWYMSYWFNTTKTIDYSIKHVLGQSDDTFVTLERSGEFPMPIDLLVTYTDGTKEMFYIPVNETLGNKPVEDRTIARNDLEAWPWVNPTYTLKISRPASQIKSLEIDPTKRMADIEQGDNAIELAESLVPYSDKTK